MPITRKTLRVEAPFSDGVCTDTPPDQLRATQTPDADNLVLSEGIAVERGGWAYVGATDPMTASAEGLASVRAVRFQGEESDTIMVSSADGYVGVATSDALEGVVFSDAGVVYYPRAFFQGEVIWCPQDRTSPIRRTVDLTTAPVTGTGTFATFQDTTVITGTGTNFDPNVPVGSYIYRGLYRVIARESDTVLTIAERPSESLSGITPDPTSYGKIGLKTLVTDRGIATHGGSATTVTGNATTWATDSPGAGAVEVGDEVHAANSPDPESLVVTAVAGTTLTVAANSVGAYSGGSYAVLRSAVGAEACVHRNSLYITGVDWNPNGLYKLPLGIGLGATINPAYSNLTEPIDAAQLDSVDVGGEDGKGRIVALSSSGDALWVHLDDSLYRVTGEWPALNVQHVADYGTREIRAVVAADDAIYFAGTEGIFALRGGSLENLCEERGRRGGRLSEWRQQIKGSTRCVLGMVRGHLFISTGEAPRECWLFDLRNDRWCGNLTSEDGAATGMESAAYFDSARDVILDPVLEDAGRDRLLMVTESTSTLRIGDVASVIPDNPSGGVEVDSVNLGRFRAVTPTNIAGSIARQKRVVGAKVGYVLTGDEAMTLEVTANVDQAAAATTEANLPTGDGYDVKHVRIPAASGFIGQLGRSFQMAFRRSAAPTSSSRVAIHYLELVVGERRPRA